VFESVFVLFKPFGWFSCYQIFLDYLAFYVIPKDEQQQYEAAAIATTISIKARTARNAGKAVSLVSNTSS
jgi:hypothetical protein